MKLWSLPYSDDRFPSIKPSPSSRPCHFMPSFSSMAMPLPTFYPMDNSSSSMIVPGNQVADDGFLFVASFVNGIFFFFQAWGFTATSSKLGKILTPSIRSFVQLLGFKRGAQLWHCSSRAFPFLQRSILLWWLKTTRFNNAPKLLLLPQQFCGVTIPQVPCVLVNAKTPSRILIAWPREHPQALFIQWPHNSIETNLTNSLPS